MNMSINENELRPVAPDDLSVPECVLPVGGGDFVEPGVPAGNGENICGDVHLDGRPAAGTIEGDAPRIITLMSLGKYGDDDYITKKELCAAFKCGPRTVQRMVERFEISPPMWFAGRKVWIVGDLRKWIADMARRNNAEAERVAKKMNVFSY